MKNVLIKSMWTFELWFCRERLETINALRYSVEVLFFAYCNVFKAGDIDLSCLSSAGFVQ